MKHKEAKRTITNNDIILVVSLLLSSVLRSHTFRRDYQCTFKDELGSFCVFNLCSSNNAYCDVATNICGCRLGFVANNKTCLTQMKLGESCTTQIAGICSDANTASVVSSPSKSQPLCTCNSPYTAVQPAGFSSVSGQLLSVCLSGGMCRARYLSCINGSLCDCNKGFVRINSTCRAIVSLGCTVDDVCSTAGANCSCLFFNSHTSTCAALGGTLGGPCTASAVCYRQFSVCNSNSCVCSPGFYSKLGLCGKDEGVAAYMFAPSGLYPAPLANAKAAHVNKIKANFRFLRKFKAKGLLDSRMV
jgi:hypothetical protein